MVSCEHLARNMPELRSSLQLHEGRKDRFLEQFDLDVLIDMDMDDSMPIYDQIRRFFKREANLPLATVFSKD